MSVWACLEKGGRESSGRFRSHRERERERKAMGYRKRPPLYAHVPCPFFEVTSQALPPDPPVKTRASVSRFWGCKNG